MDATSIIMIIGAVFIAVFSLPNLISVLRTKNTAGINLAMYLIFTFACIMFAIYGAGMIADNYLGGGLPVLLSNTFCIVIAVITLVIKFMNMRRAKKAGQTELQY
jgi:MtN3 and saliva related transmembrane protein